MSFDSSVNFYFASSYGAQAPWAQESYEKNRKRDAIERKAFANVDPATLIKLKTSIHAPRDIKTENRSVMQANSDALKPPKKIQKPCTKRFHSPTMQKIHREFVARRIQANRSMDPANH